MGNQFKKKNLLLFVFVDYCPKSMSAKNQPNIESYGCKPYELTRFYYILIGDLFSIGYIIIFVLIVSISSICEYCILGNISSQYADNFREICKIQ